MDRQLTQLTALVDQLIDAARISSGKILLDWKDIDLVSWCARCSTTTPGSSRMPA